MGSSAWSRYAVSETVLRDADYWTTRRDGTLARLPVDAGRGPNCEASARTITVALTGEETSALLQQVPRAYNTQINDALLTAVAQAFTESGRGEQS